MGDENTEYNAACHCGTVRFRVRLAGGLSTARRCTCSLLPDARRGRRFR